MTVTPQWLRSIQRETAPNPGPHSRRDEWPVEPVHGRLQWTPTPQHLAAVPDFELTAEGRQARGLVKDARARAQAAVMALLGVLLVLTGLMMGGCHVTTYSPVTALPAPPKIVVLSERVGSAAADIIETATGQRPFAATLPYLPVIVFSPKDADDPGLIAHEMCHKRQQADLGEARWAALYVRDFLECERMAVERGACLKTIPMEAECYLIQRQIAAKGATP